MQAMADALYPIWVVIFTVVFVGFGVWVFWPSRRRKRRIKDDMDISFREDADERRRS